MTGSVRYCSFYESPDEDADVCYSGSGCSECAAGGQFNPCHYDRRGTTAATRYSSQSSAQNISSPAAAASPLSPKESAISSTGVFFDRTPALTRSYSDRTPRTGRTTITTSSAPTHPTGPTSPVYAVQTSSVSDDAPWWISAVDKTIAAQASRSSTLPRTVRDSAEQKARLAATAGVHEDGAWMPGSGGKSCRDDKSTARHKLKPALKNAQWRVGLLETTEQEWYRERSSLTVASMELSSPHRTAPAKDRSTTKKSSNQHSSPVAVQQHPPSMSVLTAKQLCADGERLSNYAKVTDAPAAKSWNSMHANPRDASSSSYIGSGQNEGGSTPTTRVRERWLASDGSSTENLPAIGVGMPAIGKMVPPKRVVENRSASTRDSKGQHPTPDSAILFGESEQNASKQRIDPQQQQQQQRQTRRSLEVSRSADQLPAPAISLSMTPTFSSATGKSGTQYPEFLMTSSLSAPCRSGSTSSGSNGRGSVLGDEGGGVDALSWPDDGGRHRSEVCRSDSANTSDYRKIVAVGGPGASNSVPRGMTLCVAKSTTTGGATGHHHTTQITSGSNGGSSASVTSASNGLTVTCSGPSPKRSLSNRDDDC